MKSFASLFLDNRKKREQHRLVEYLCVFILANLSEAKKRLLTAVMALKADDCQYVSVVPESRMVPPRPSASRPNTDAAPSIASLCPPTLMPSTFT